MISHGRLDAVPSTRRGGTFQMLQHPTPGTTERSAPQTKSTPAAASTLRDAAELRTYGSAPLITLGPDRLCASAKSSDYIQYLRIQQSLLFSTGNTCKMSGLDPYLKKIINTILQQNQDSDTVEIFGPISVCKTFPVCLAEPASLNGSEVIQAAAC